MKKSNKGFIDAEIIIGGLVLVVILFLAIRLGIAKKEVKEAEKITESKIESIINNNDTFIYNEVEVDKSTAKELLEKGYFAFREKGTTKVYIEKENNAPVSQKTTLFIPLPIS